MRIHETKLDDETFIFAYESVVQMLLLFGGARAKTMV